MMSAMWPLHKAVYTKLDAALTEDVRTEPQQSLPYVRMQWLTEDDSFSTHDTPGGAVSLQVTPYAKSLSDLQAMITTVFQEVGPRVQLTLDSGYQHIRTEIESSNLLPEDDADRGTIYGNPIRLRYFITQP